MSAAPRVLKFGGSSLATEARLAAALAIVERAASRGPIVVVVSALAGVTDQLARAAERAAGGDEGVHEVTAALRERHEALLVAVAPGAEGAPAQTAYERHLRAATQALGHLLQPGAQNGHGRATVAALLATGERLVAPLFAAALAARGLAAESVDAASLIVGAGDPLEVTIDTLATTARLRAWWAEPHAPIVVVTGFVAGTADGATALLGRGGSDTSATLIGAALGSRVVEIWTDVDGVRAADPADVPEARALPTLDHEGATLLARHGARVLHPRALAPAAASGATIRVRATQHARRPGTRIVAGATPGAWVAIASDRAIARLHVRAAVRPAALAEALRAAAIPVLAAEAEREGLTLLLPASAAACARDTLARMGFAAPRAAERDGSLAVVAVVGAAPRAGTAERVRTALARAGIALALGPLATRRRSLAVLVAPAARAAAVRALHAAFLPRPARIDLVVVGARGRVARALGRLLAARGEALRTHAGLELRVVGASSRERLAWDEGGLPADALAEALGAGGPATTADVVARALAGRRTPLLVADCTAGEELASFYPELLAAGVGVVTPNKRANARTHAFWRRLHASARAGRAPYRYATTAGAGLPVLAALRDLCRRGDRVHRLEAVLSGSVSAVLHALHEGQGFSAAVADARARGLTEPHPGEDLSGEDVARKLLIVLREAGLKFERGAITVAPLVPDELRRERDPERFLAALPALDEAWRERASAAAAAGQRLVLIARYDGERASVGVEARPADEPLARLCAGENMVVLHSDHHEPLPLTLAGAGAGPELTAAGVLTDLIEAAREMLPGRYRAARAASRAASA